MKEQIARFSVEGSHHTGQRVPTVPLKVGSIPRETSLPATPGEQVTPTGFEPVLPA